MVTLICSGWQCRLLWNHPSAIDLKERRRRGTESLATVSNIGKSSVCPPQPQPVIKWRLWLLSDQPLLYFFSHCIAVVWAWFVLEACICCLICFCASPCFTLSAELFIATVFHARSKAAFFFLSHAGLWLISPSMLVYFNLGWEVSDSLRLLRKIKL